MASDFVIVDCTSGSTDPATAPDFSATLLAALADAQTNNMRIVFKGAFGSARRWIKIAPTVTLFDGVQIDTWGKVGIRATTASGAALFHAQGSILVEGDLIIDGGNTSETVANGYQENHTGLLIRHPTGGTYIEDIAIDGVEFRNFGFAGLEVYFGRNLSVERAVSRRIGCAGFLYYSPKTLRQRGGGSYNIFPGQPPSPDVPAYNRNAYGVAVTQSGGDPQAEDVLLDGLTIEDVTTWEGIDGHTVKAFKVVNCRIKGCSQGIAVENHLAGVQVEDVQIRGNSIAGFGAAGSVTRDGLECPSQGGIIVNAQDALQSTQVIITDNNLTGCGERRPGVTSGAGAIAVRNARAGLIANNTCYINQQVGINLLSANDGHDSILDTLVTANAVVGITSHMGVKIGIQYGPYVQGAARGNTVVGADSPAAAYHRNGSAVYDFSVGTVGTYGSGADNFWN